MVMMAMQSAARIACIGLFALGMAPAASEACSCGWVDRTTPAKNQKYISEQFKHSRAVFLGEIVAVDRFVVTVKVEQVWKGRLPGQVILGTGRTLVGQDLVRENTCIDDFLNAGGQKYLVFADGPSITQLSSHRCGPTQPVANAAAVLPILNKLAKPRPPRG